MAITSARGRKQDLARVAGGQDYEVRYEPKKTEQSNAKVKSAVKKAGSSRKRVKRATRVRADQNSRLRALRCLMNQLRG
jgi:hypothetical protein